jgi:hypothetical protein
VVLEGRLDLAGNGYGPGQAAWLPPDWRGEIAAIPGVSDLVLLLAIAGR